MALSVTNTMRLPLSRKRSPAPCEPCLAAALVSRLAHASRAITEHVVSGGATSECVAAFVRSWRGLCDLV